MEAPTADEWIAHRAKMRNTANYTDANSFHQSRGTEHHRERDGDKVKPGLDKPRDAEVAV